VTRLAAHIQSGDEFKDLWIEGEVVQARSSPVGHVYFTLRDNVGQLQCVLFAMKAAQIALTPRDGSKVLAHGYIELYTKDGRCQLQVDDLRPAGAGEAYLRFEALKRRFPRIVGPHKEDICYATTNRQEAVKRVAPGVDAMIVVGAPNSSNSQQLKEVAERSGCPYAVLVQRSAEIDWKKFDGVRKIGVTAGASAPEVLVEEVLGAFAERYVLEIETISAAEEGMFFPLPRPLREEQAAE